MKVKVTGLKPGRKFRRYKVTFWVETREEAERFHDDVAIKVCKDPHKFIGTVFGRCQVGGPYNDYEGRI